METIKGTVTKILFFNDDTGYKVLRIYKTNGSPMVITGEFGPEIIQNTTASFHGEYRTHPKYGPQFKVYSYEITYDAQRQTSIQMFIDNVAPNIGPERSLAIITHFGDKTIEILDKNPERLLEVEGIGKVSADSLAKAWNENKNKWEKERSIYSFRAFLNSLGIRERRIKRVLTYLGGEFDAEKRIRENPYLLTNINGFGFTTTDYIARKLGFSEASPFRFKAFIKYLIEIICPSYGHIYLKRGDIPTIINTYCRENGTTFINKDFVSESDIETVLNDLSEDESIIVDEGKIYSLKNYEAENNSAFKLANIISEKSDLLFLNVQAVEEFIKEYEKENRIIFSDEQRKAIHLFAEEKVFVITGGPGTGKTTLLKAIVEMANRMKLKFTCMTPTGISAKKLATTIKYDAYTIHRRLGYRGDHWLCNEESPYETDIVIVDECSMVDQEVLYRMLCALKKRIHLIFVGDQDQLPSVGAGNVLKELINSRAIPVIRLEKIFRQAEASEIITAAHKIKNGDTDLSLFKNDPKADIFFMREQSKEEIERYIITMAQKFKDDHTKLFQIITPRNDGPLSVDTLNNALQQALNPPNPILPEINMGLFIIRKGDRVIIRRNDYERDIYNGDIGKVVSIGKGLIHIRIDEKTVELTFDDTKEIVKLAYAITVHKAQGTEYPYIILPYINQHGKNMLKRNLLYTAITRAKTKVIVLGHGSAIEKAINNATVTKRNTKLGERIQKCLQKKKRASLFLSPEEPRNSPNQQKSKEVSLPKTEEYYPTATAAE